MRRLDYLISACEAKKQDIAERLPSLHWVLFDRTLHNVHLLRRLGMFDHENNFCLCLRSKVVQYARRSH